MLTLHILHTLVPKAHISILARYPFQVEHATRLGADHIIYPMNPYDSVERTTHSRVYKGILSNRTLLGGYDAIYDTVGERNTLHHALRWLRAQGTMVLVGFSPHMMHIDLTPIWHQEINLLGSLSHGRETWPPEASNSLGNTPSGLSTFSVVTELIQQKRIQPEQLITHRFALDKYKDALIAVKHKKHSQAIKVLFDYAKLPALAVPNARTSARPVRPALPQPQDDTFTEEVLKAENTTGPRRDSEQEQEQEAVQQPNIAQPTFSSKILETPSPQAFTKETWQTILNRQDVNQDDTDEDTDPAIPVVKRPPYHPHVSPRVAESPQTPIPPAIEPTPALIGETSKTKTDELEENSISAQPALEPQQAEAVSEFFASIDPMLSEFPVELPTNEEESAPPLSDTTRVNAWTEEQLPTQTVLDNLFDTDTSSMPEFLAQLSNFSAPNAPEMPFDKEEASIFPALSFDKEEAPTFPAMPFSDTGAFRLTELRIEDTQASSPTDTPVEDAQAPSLTEVPIEDTEVSRPTDTPVEDTEAPRPTDTPVEDAQPPSLTEMPVEDTEAPRPTD
ncbi:MAG: zinc-binding dehydrogenase, partial [Chloroflexi bacterium]